MRLFFSKHELKLRRKRNIAAIICVVIVLGAYWILTRPQKIEPEMPTVIVEPVVKDDVEIYPVQPGVPRHFADRQRIVNTAVGGFIGEIRQQVQSRPVLLGVFDGL